MRGAGRSATPVQPYSNTEDLYQLLKFLKVSKASLVGISRDLQSTPNRHPMHQRLAAAAEHLRKHHTQALNVSHLADMVGLSVAQFERQFRKVYELSPRQMHTQARIQAATQWLAQPLSVAQVAQHCGYTDHSAFVLVQVVKIVKVCTHD